MFTVFSSSDIIEDDVIILENRFEDEPDLAFQHVAPFVSNGPEVQYITLLKIF